MSRRRTAAFWSTFLFSLRHSHSHGLTEIAGHLAPTEGHGGGVPRRIFLWNGAERTPASSCGDERETQQAYVDANENFDVEVHWTNEGDAHTGLAQLQRNVLVRDGFDMLRHLHVSGGIYVSAASWPGEPFSAVLTEDDAFVMGVAVDRQSGQRHLLFLAAVEDSPITAAMVSAADAALRSPADTYQRMWEDPLSASLPADRLEERHFTGITMMDAILQDYVSSGTARIVEYDVKVVALPINSETPCGTGARMASTAAKATSSVMTSVFLNLAGEGLQPVGAPIPPSAATLSLGQALRPGQYISPARSKEDKAAAALEPLWPVSADDSAAASDVTATAGFGAVPACAAATSGCFLWLSRDGQLALYTGMGLLDPAAQLATVLVPAPAGAAAAAAAVASTRWVALDDEGDALLLSLPPAAAGASRDDAAIVVWRAGSRFPAGCTSSECRADVFFAVLADGALELRRRVSSAMVTYITVGAAATKRLEKCLWHNDFAAKAVAAGGATVPPRPPLQHPPEENGGGGATPGCIVPPALMLATFPNSGTSFTLQSTQQATVNAVYTSYEHEVEHTDEDTPPLQDLCGYHACHELGMCQLTKGARGEIMARDGLRHLPEDDAPTPPAGKGALIKSHVADFGTGVFCGEKGVDRYRTALAQGNGGAMLERYGVLRLFRNPYDNMVARFHLLTNTDQLEVDHSKAGFLADDGHIPKRDIYTYLYWHLNANIVFQELGLPVALLTYEDIYEDTVAFLRSVVSMLGWTPREVSDARLEDVAQRVLAREYVYLRSGERLPVYIDEYYDAETIEFIVDVVNDIIDRTDCLQTPNYLAPSVGPVSIP